MNTHENRLPSYLNLKKENNQLRSKYINLRQRLVLEPDLESEIEEYDQVPTYQTTEVTQLVSIIGHSDKVLNIIKLSFK